MLSSADAQVELKTPLTDSGQAQLSLSSPVTEIAASLDTGELDTGTGHPEETSKPPEVNVSQVWVQDSPQDYINDGELNSSSDPHMADLTTVTAALQQIKVWMTSRLEELDSELLEQWQDIEAGRQLEDRLRKLITASPCVESLEQQLLKYGKNSMKQDTLLWGISAATRHA
ncbi:transmembrane protein [Cystoisospora suis]|uniref:Transmembrane protein n=1 Tax=Cystoisospora suis TaxID=483139 RepID=A0A2C6J6R1_9APIC|nr:transmembrane protein [Cystoisospora suis]